MITENLLDLFQQNSIGIKGGDLFANSMPSTPDDAVAIVDTGLIPPNHSWRGQVHRINILVRSRDYSGGLMRCRNIAQYIDSINSVEVADGNIIMTVPLSDVIHLPSDKLHRHMFIYKVDIYKEVL